VYCPKNSRVQRQPAQFRASAPFNHGQRHPRGPLRSPPIIPAPPRSQPRPRHDLPCPSRPHSTICSHTSWTLSPATQPCGRSRRFTITATRPGLRSSGHATLRYVPRWVTNASIRCCWDWPSSLTGGSSRCVVPRMHAREAMWRPTGPHLPLARPNLPCWTKFHSLQNILASCRHSLSLI